MLHVIYMGECSWVALGRSLVVFMRFWAEDNANRHVDVLTHLHGGNALESLLSPLFFPLVSSLLSFLVSSLFSSRFSSVFSAVFSSLFSSRFSSVFSSLFSSLCPSFLSSLFSPFSLLGGLRAIFAE